MTFTTPSKHDPDGIDIDNNFEEQEKWEQTYYLDGNVFIKMTNGMWKVIDGNDGLVKTISPRPERNPMSDIREKIEEQVRYYEYDGVLESSDSGKITDTILSIVREAVSAVKPKERITPHEERFDDEIRCGNVGYNQGVSDYHDALMEVLS